MHNVVLQIAIYLFPWLHVLCDLVPNDTKWKTIHGRKRRATPVYSTCKGTKLIAGPRQYDLFVFRVNRDSGVEDVSNYLKETDDTITVVDNYLLTDIKCKFLAR